MNNDVAIIGTFYLKNGNIIEEEVTCDKNDMENVIENIKSAIKEGFREDVNFSVTFGFTTFRGKDISAVTFTVMA